MSIAISRNLERNKLRYLINEYSSLGYSVFANYKDYPKPENIGQFVPDLILKKGEETIIVEITTQQTSKRLGKKMEQLARYAEEHENIRFDVVYTNPRPRLSSKEKEISNEILLTEIQKRLLSDSKELSKIGNYEASFIMLTILLENALMKFAVKKKAISIHETIPTTKLVPFLLRQGVISKSNSESIMKFLAYRNKIIHRSYKPSKQILQEYERFVSFLLKKGK